MKFLALFGVLCLVAFSSQVPLFDGCDETVEKLFDKESCITVQCYSFQNETLNVHKMSANSCPMPKCETGKLTGENEADATKVYPDCCATAICE